MRSNDREFARTAHDSRGFDRSMKGNRSNSRGGTMGPGGFRGTHKSGEGLIKQK